MFFFVVGTLAVQSMASASEVKSCSLKITGHCKTHAEQIQKTPPKYKVTISGDSYSFEHKDGTQSNHGALNRTEEIDAENSFEAIGKVFEKLTNEACKANGCDQQ